MHGPAWRKRQEEVGKGCGPPATHSLSSSPATATSRAPNLIGLLKQWYRSPTTMSSTFRPFTRSAESDLTSLTVNGR